MIKRQPFGPMGQHGLIVEPSTQWEQGGYAPDRPPRLVMLMAVCIGGLCATAGCRDSNQGTQAEPNGTTPGLTAPPAPELQGPALSVAELPANLVLWAQLSHPGAIPVAWTSLGQPRGEGDDTRSPVDRWLAGQGLGALRDQLAADAPLHLLLLTAEPGRLEGAAVIRVRDPRAARAALSEDWEATVDPAVYRTGWSYGPDRRLRLVGNTVLVTSSPAGMAAHRAVLERAAVTESSAPATIVLNVSALAAGRHAEQVRGLARVAVGALEAVGQTDLERVGAGARALVGLLLRDVRVVSAEVSFAHETLAARLRALPTVDGQLGGKLRPSLAHPAELLAGVPAAAVAVLATRATPPALAVATELVAEGASALRALLRSLGHGVVVLLIGEGGPGQLVVSRSLTAPDREQLVSGLSEPSASTTATRDDRTALGVGVDQATIDAAAAAKGPPPARLLQASKAAGDVAALLWVDPIGALRAVAGAPATDGAGHHDAVDPILARDLAAQPANPGLWAGLRTSADAVELSLSIPLATALAWERAQRVLIPARLRASARRIAAAFEAAKAAICACKTAECTRPLVADVLELERRAGAQRLDAPERKRIRIAASEITACVQRALSR